ncbi:MAG: ImmA/IrrE family metallo-endopeptidase [Anaerolineales bacterium]|nr:ImmA/IrrE family metallo-endopeptidase [Anaerolineales bacterium]
MNTQLVNIIFGMKVKQARTDSGMNLTEFASQCDLSSSYVTEIEKGRKYPRADKIMRMAEVLNKEYDELVSIRLEPPLTHLGSALSSPVLGQFPFEEFGIEMSDLVNVLTREPGKASALLHAIAELGRQFDLKEQHFLRAALRSYQELHDNYFPELEEEAQKFAKKHKLHDQIPVSTTQLEELLRTKYKFEIDHTQIKADSLLSKYRSVYIRGAKPQLVVNPQLQPHQIKFELARELGYQYLKLTDRAYTSAPDQVDSFQQVFNDFKASYFAGALLMPSQFILDDIQAFFELTSWSPKPLYKMLEKYDVSPEALLYRFSELVPQFFGTKLHFLRLHNGSDGRYHLVKQLNLNRLRVPNGLAADEHFCRRWLVVRLLRELKQQRANQTLSNGHAVSQRAPVVGVQMSEYIDSRDHFLCFGFARPLSLSPGVDSCGIIGFRAENLHNIIRFAKDPSIPHVNINETCERCALTLDQCNLRAAEPSVLLSRKERAARKEELRQLLDRMRA